jgi:hypothetical protein
MPSSNSDLHKHFKVAAAAAAAAAAASQKYLILELQQMAVIWFDLIWFNYHSTVRQLSQNWFLKDKNDRKWQKKTKILQKMTKILQKMTKK